MKCDGTRQQLKGVQQVPRYVAGLLKLELFKQRRRAAGQTRLHPQGAPPARRVSPAAGNTQQQRLMLRTLRNNMLRFT